jgi:hypothetical protein
LDQLAIGRRGNASARASHAEGHQGAKAYLSPHRSATPTRPRQACASARPNARRGTTPRRNRRHCPESCARHCNGKLQLRRNVDPSVKRQELVVCGSQNCGTKRKQLRATTASVASGSGACRGLETRSSANARRLRCAAPASQRVLARATSAE